MSSSWWKSDAGQADGIWAHIRQLETRQRQRVWRDYVNESIYGSTIGADGGRHGLQAEQLRSSGFLPADLNFTRTIIDSLVARIGNDRPAIKFAADGANWGERRKAKQLERVIEGETERLDLSAKMPLVLRDCLVTRGGVLMIHADQGRIVADRVPCEELYFDEREARYGEPRQLHRVIGGGVAKEVLAAKFPEHASKIWSAPPPQPKPNDFEARAGDNSGMAEVAMSWHLPSKPGGDDGKRTISIPGQVLHTEAYKRSTYPMAILRWAPPRRGFWGASLVDELAALQFKVNEVARDLMQNIYFTSALKVFVRRGANLAKKHLSGKRPHFVEVDAIGSDVLYDAPDGFSQAQFQFLQWLIAQMFEVSGVSQLMAQGKNPLGAGASGAALNEVYQQDSERFSQVEQAVARCWRDSARLIVEAAQDLADDKEFRQSEIRWSSKRGLLEQVKWADVDLETDRFELHLEPSGFMPSTRGGKMQAIEQLMANGILDPKMAVSLIEFPDLKRALMVQNAPVEWALWAVGEVGNADLDADGEVDEDSPNTRPIPAPDPHVDLDFAMTVAKAVYNIRQIEGDPPAILGRYLTFLDALDAEIKKAAPAAPEVGAGMAPPPMDPMAGGAPPMPDAGALPPGPMPMMQGVA